MVENKKPSEMDGALFIDNEGGDSPQRHHDDDLATQEDGKAELASEMLHEILTRMGLKANVEIREDAEEVILDIGGEDAGRAIGKKGMTLDALQFIVNKIVNRFPDGRRHIVLDSGDYRERREAGLASLARREAKRALQQGRTVTLEPMSPRDRRVIHLSLAKFNGVSTRSDGQGNERRVRIIPAGRQGRGGGGGDRGPRFDRGPRVERTGDRGPSAGGNQSGDGSALSDHEPGPSATDELMDE